MEVILLEKVYKLGELGDRVRVKAGYGRNYLIPQRMAVPATPENIAEFEARRAELERAQAEALAAAQARAEQLEGREVTVRSRAGTEGRLFGSVGTAEIAEALTAAGVEVEKREVRLPSGPLREVGDHTVGVQVHADIHVDVTVHVAPEEQLGAGT